MANVGAAAIDIIPQFDPAQLRRTAQRMADIIEAEINARLRRLRLPPIPPGPGGGGAGGGGGGAGGGGGGAGGGLPSPSLLNSVLNSLKGIATQLIKIGSLAAGITFAFASRATIEIDRLRQTLTGLQGQLGTSSSESFAEIVKLSNEASLSFEDTTASVVKLSVALGTDLKGALEVTRELAAAGAAAGSSSEAINRAALALAQIAARGTLAAEEINQLADAIPSLGRTRIFEELAVRLGKTSFEVRKLALDGKILSSDAIPAIREALRTVPGAAEALELRANSLSGILTRLGNNFKLLSEQVLGPVFRALATVLQPLLSNLEKGGQSAAAVFGGKLVAAFQQLLPSLQRLGAAIGQVFSNFVENLPAMVAILEDVIDFVSLLIERFNLLQPAIRFIYNLLVQLADALSFLANPFASAADGAQSFLNRIVASNSPLASFARRIGLSAQAVVSFDDDLKQLSSTSKGSLVSSLAQAGVSAALVGAGMREVATSFKGPLADFDSQIDGIKTNLNQLLDARENAVRVSKALVDANKALAKTQADFNRIINEGGEAELAAARERLTDATERINDALDRRVDLEARLAELLTPATERELSDAADVITRAEIALSRALRARDEAQKALNVTNEEALEIERPRVNLAGLTLDQLRSTLSNIRASIAAQKATAKVEKAVVTDVAKTREELNEDAALAELGVRDAVKAVTDARSALLTLETRARTETPATLSIRKDLEDAEDSIADAMRAEMKVRSELQSIEAGDSEFSRNLIIVREAVASAEERVRDAHKESALAIAAERDALNDLNGVNSVINDQLAIRLGLNQDLISQSQNLQNLVVSANSGLSGLNFLSAEAIGALSKRLLSEPSSAIRQLLVELSRGSGNITAGIPWFAQGGLVTRPTVAGMGEGNRPELVLPLDPTKHTRAAWLMNQFLPPRLLDPLAPPVLRSAPLLSGATAISRASGGNSSRMDLASLIGALAEVLKDTRGVSITNDIHVSTPVDDPNLMARRLRREIERSWRRL